MVRDGGGPKSAMWEAQLRGGVPGASMDPEQLKDGLVRTLLDSSEGVTG